MGLVREVEIEGRRIRFEFGKYAKQANGSVMVSAGGTQVLVTVCAARHANPELDFFPLGVDYIEKTYSAGRIPPGFSKREGKPSEASTLMARVIDRPLRPCFPKGFRNETVITATVMSYEHGYSPAPLALIGASTALMISDIPFSGPVAAVRLGIEGGKTVYDPQEGFEDELDLELNLACKPDAVLMVEAGAKFLPEAQVIEAIATGHRWMQPLFEMQLEVQREIGKPKWTVPEPADLGPATKALERHKVDALLEVAMATSGKQERSAALEAARESVFDKILGKAKLSPGVDSVLLGQAWERRLRAAMRQRVLSERVRIDGRKLDEIRTISCETGVLSVPHGSALFTRGETQALAAVTLASEDEQQRGEALWDGNLKQRFMLHYNFPPFSVGEARMQRAPGRREVGHGALARRALAPVLPDTGEFGYTIRLVSEILESNGSSSMATVCAGSMALLHAGVPLRHQVAGIAMGLIKEGEQVAVLSDISGTEDALGDMDFKVCGTRDAITALQMDIKVGGLSQELLAQALEQARRGRLAILEKQVAAIAEPSDNLAANAPRIFRIKIAPEKIRDVIGPGGKNIKHIAAQTKVKIDIEDGGMILIAAPTGVAAETAKSMIRNIVSEPEVGDIILGRVVRITDFGAFVELKPGVDGLCHVTQLANERVAHTRDLVKEGDEMLVKVVDVDRQGRIKLSRKDALGKEPTA